MTVAATFIFIGAAFSAAFLFTWQLRRFALARNLMDVPNSRSSHHLPTPRGGGVSIVLVMLICLPLLWWQDNISWKVLTAFAGAGVTVALVGWLDDHGHVAARWRLLVHFAASAWGLAWLGGLPPLVLLNHEINFGLFGQVLAVFYLAWLLNLYNFMDGIDGIAGIEALTVCCGSFVICLLFFSGDFAGSFSKALPSLLLASATLGFLCWNFPRARIFMGDAGSGFVGMLLGLLSLKAAWISTELFMGWLILLGSFIVDATLTLFVRMFRRERIYNAHRSHAYQYAARLYGSHIPVSLAFGAINLCWLLPIAGMVTLGYLECLLGLVIAWTPLVILALYYRAGQRELSDESP